MKFVRILGKRYILVPLNTQDLELINQALSREIDRQLVPSEAECRYLLKERIIDNWVDLQNHIGAEFERAND